MDNGLVGTLGVTVVLPVVKAYIGEIKPVTIQNHSMVVLTVQEILLKQIYAMHLFNVQVRLSFSISVIMYYSVSVYQL